MNYVTHHILLFVPFSFIRIGSPDCSNLELVYKTLIFFVLLVGFLLGGIGISQGLTHITDIHSCLGWD
jgi:hypothetical protein